MRGAAFVSVVLFLLLLAPCAMTHAQRHSKATDQVGGPSAALHNQPDEQCRYPKSGARLDFMFEIPYEVRETSGLAFHDGKLLTHNDSGHKPVIYALSATDGKILQRIRLSNAVNVDWEELAMDDQYLYIGDFGNNAGKRREFQIYRIALASIPNSGDTTVLADTITFTYPDQPYDLPYLAHNYDCEAMIATADGLFLFSKNWADGHTWLYKLPSQPGSYEAQLVSRFNSRGLVTGADYQPETGLLVLVGYVNKTWTPFVWVFGDARPDDFFAGTKIRLNLTGLVTNQIEAVVFTAPGQVVITSEKSKTAAARAFSFNVNNWVASAESNSNASFKPCQKVLNIARADNGYTFEFKKKQKQFITVEFFNQEDESCWRSTISPCRNNRSLFVPATDLKSVPSSVLIATKKYKTQCPLP
ncbi:MAG TPA: hypothetical protein PKE03_09440 [Bacteroidales bacterium]|nr:hypothetical protein [Bacteroidales bacterium]